VSLTLLALGVNWLFELPVRPSTLVALALLTPSAGFILDALDGFGLPESARFWIKSKAVATELVALTVLFIVLRSASRPWRWWRWSASCRCSSAASRAWSCPTRRSPSSRS
jgi:hypothetical protein